jgi:hypothetical protein
VRFSEYYSIDPGDSDDWFDLLLPLDTPLCVDPFLIYEDESPEWRSAHGRVLEFFALAFSLMRQSKGNKEAASYIQLENLLMFPEPAEFCLGLSEGSPLGAGAGRGLQEGMIEGIRTAVGLGLQNVSHMEMLILFQGGMGLDRISDVTCNILKSYFIHYTQEVCRRHSIPTEEFVIKNASWSSEFARWKERKVQLPLNPFVTKKRLPVLLAPERFLKDIPVVTADNFWKYAWETHASELRASFNYDISAKVDARAKAMLARQNPVIVAEYLEKLEQETHEGYPIATDPKFLVNWYEAGDGITRDFSLAFAPSEPSEFTGFVRSVIESFKQNIEQQDGWLLLWSNNRGRAERVVQALFRSAVMHYCRANHIDLSGESNAGRGPVDFKFSQGWSARAVVEMKLMRNSDFWDGILAQTPQYATSEEVRAAFFVAIAYLDRDLGPDRLSKIERAVDIASSDSVTIEAVVIDARPKESSSNLSASAQDRGQLHGWDDGDGAEN